MILFLLIMLFDMYFTSEWNKFSSGTEYSSPRSTASDTNSESYHDNLTGAKWIKEIDSKLCNLHVHNETEILTSMDTEFNVQFNHELKHFNHNELKKYAQGFETTAEGQFAYYYEDTNLGIKVFKTEVLSHQDRTSFLDTFIDLTIEEFTNSVLSNQTYPDLFVKSHGLVVQPIEHSDWQSTYPLMYIVMEKCDYTLEDVLNKANPQIPRLSEKQMVQLWKTLQNANAALKALSMAHNDIKPENIFIKQHNDTLVFKLGDFGLSGQINEIRGGTPGFVTPSQMLGFPSPNADRWAAFVSFIFTITNFRFSVKKFEEQLIDLQIQENSDPKRYIDVIIKHIGKKCDKEMLKNTDIPNQIIQLFKDEIQNFNVGNKMNPLNLDEIILELESALNEEEYKCCSIM